MKVLIVAPRICTPWTEGRKKFVRDLIEASRQRWQLCGLVTLDDGQTTQLPEQFETRMVSARRDHLLFLTGNVARAIAAHRPDLVCHFPFGAFTGVRGIANLWAIRSIERTCRKAGVRCCTLMYSLTAEADTSLHRYLLRDVYFNQYAPAGRGIRFGVSLPPNTGDDFYAPHARTLVFMSGAAETSPAALDYVLDVRGLRYLLQAGAALAQMGYRLIVAVPLLESAAMRARISAHAANTWPRAQLEFRSQVGVPEIFRGASAFVFPYGQEEKQFVPTSIVEAMHFGIPVVMPRLSFLAQFCAAPQRAFVHEPCDADSLVAQVARLTAAGEDVDSVRRVAAQFVEAEYSIANTVRDLEALCAAQPRG